MRLGNESLKSEPIRYTPSLADRVVRFFSPERALKRARASIALELASRPYRASEINRLRKDWIFSKLFDDQTPDAWDLDVMVARSRDLNRNDPVASGATNTMTVNIVGTGLRPQSKIRAEVLGISETQAEDLRKQAEYIWQDWTANADSANRLDFDEIQFLMLRKIIEDGEIIALPTWSEDSWRKIKRTVELVECDRLEATENNFEYGIRFGSRGEPLEYSIRRGGTTSSSSVEYEKISARDELGRPKVLHVFQTLRPGQKRGIPYFAPVMSYFHDLASTVEAEVMASRISACMAVFVTAKDPFEMMNLSATGTETATNARIQGIEPGLVGYLNPGESINVVDPKRPGDTFAPFVEQVLRIIGIAIGMPYELLVKDFSKTNYSSARASILEARRMFVNWRSWFSRKACQPIWALVLEEAFLRGMFNAPRFYEFLLEYTRAIWIGGAWGWVDPTKEVEASKMAIDYGLSTYAEEVAGQGGKDWEEVFDQRAREKKKESDLGLNFSGAANKKQAPDTAGEEEEKDEDEDDAQA